MKSGKEILNERLIVSDGAMGTYFAGLYQMPVNECEVSNLSQPEKILSIHKSYLEAGAKLLRANSFAAVQGQITDPDSDYLEIIRKGYLLARQAVTGYNAWAAADFGPVYGIEIDLLKNIWSDSVKMLVKEGADLFVLETFADPDELAFLSQTIKSENQDAVIIASFAISADGFTRKGLSLQDLSLQVEKNDNIDILGLNCGIGPTHLRRLVSQLPLTGKPLSLMPNSGYPRLENQRMVFGSEPGYFAQSIADISHPRLLIVGGCCGTTPDHIRELSRKVFDPLQIDKMHAEPVKIIEQKENASDNWHKIEQQPLRLVNKIRNKDFIMICELDPPGHSDLSKLLLAARILAASGIDAITVADSPLARVKLDPVIAAARIYRETGISVLPHLTCRDRNVNALRSLILGAHSEGVRQLLAVTGDRISESEHGFVKPVFNINSNGLLALINQINQELSDNDRIIMAAAMDTGTRNSEVEFKRIINKADNGAEFFLTQPIYEWNEQVSELIRLTREKGLSVILGIMPLVSYRNACYMDQEVPGINIPDRIIRQFEPGMSKADAENIGLKQILDIARAAKDHVDGFYLIAPFNRVNLISRFIKDFIP
jgi:homocysteine S-methyltransferase